MLSLVGNVNIETLDDLKIVLEEVGYSERVITEILKHYAS